MFVARNDEVGLGFKGALQDAVIGIVGNYSQVLIVINHFRKTFNALDGAFGLGMVPQELRLDYPLELFEDLRGNEIANSFSPGPEDCFSRSGFGKVEGRNKDIGVDNHLKHVIVRRGICPLLAGCPPQF